MHGRPVYSSPNLSLLHSTLKEEEEGGQGEPSGTSTPAMGDEEGETESTEEVSRCQRVQDFFLCLTYYHQ